ncbi:MAG: N-acetylneuraminate lyase [Treponemataceae bacterium]
MKSLKGIFPALLTPFERSGRVDEENLRKLVSVNIGRGVDGFYACGSTAEAFLLTIEERKRILEIVVGEVAGRVPVICHIGAIGTDLSIDLGKHAAASGADAVSSIPPFYYKFSGEEVICYYRDIADAIDLPVIPYNFPALSGVTLTGDLIRRLREHPRIVGVKFTSNDLFQLERMKKDDPELIVYNGFDEIFLAGFSMGADGAIGSTFNFMPEKFLGIRKRLLAGDLAGARVFQDQANEVIQALVETGKLLNAQKYLVGLQGIPCGDCRRPFLPLTDEDKTKLEKVARRCLELPGSTKAR